LCVILCVTLCEHCGNIVCNIVCTLCVTDVVIAHISMSNSYLFTAYNVFSGLVTAWRLAACPTSLLPSPAKLTTDGVVRAPSLFSITRAVRPSMIATQLFVVPRSMPITSPASGARPPSEVDNSRADPVLELLFRKVDRDPRKAKLAPLRLMWESMRREGFLSQKVMVWWRMSNLKFQPSKTINLSSRHKPFQSPIYLKTW